MQLNLIAAVAVFGSSGILFHYYYSRASFFTWKMKINPLYPTPAMIKNEVYLTLKGMTAASLMPALSIYLANNQDSTLSVFLKEKFNIQSQAFCRPTTDAPPLYYDIGFFFAVWFLSDFYEFFYHWCGHYFTALWTVHKHHHRFYIYILF